MLKKQDLEQAREAKFGIVGIQHHKITCIIGIHPNERTEEQSIYVDLRVKVDFVRCAVADQIDAAVDYVQLADVCTKLAQERKYHLLETFAYEVTTYLLQILPIEWIWIRIKKPLALSSAEYALVEFERSKGKGL